MTKWMLGGAMIALAAGCPAEDVLVELDNTGNACLGDDEGGEVTLVEDGPVTVHVRLENCASGCAFDLQTECTATVDGTTITVDAQASYLVPGGTPTCPAICAFVDAECETANLPAGTYTVEYGTDASDSFDVPSTATDVCAGEAS